VSGARRLTAVPEPPYILLAGSDVERLARFRADHPDVLICSGGFGTWQALIPEPAGERVAVRYTLGDLLDRLDMFYPPDD
jgi:hypothetical protein